MKVFRVSTVVLLSAALTLLAVSAAPVSAAAKPHKTTYGTLTIKITKTGSIVWGKVTVKPINKTCSASSCTFGKIKVGTKLTLTETPTSNSSWPFDVWAVNGKSGSSPSTTLTLTMGKKDTVTVTYLDAAQGVGKLTVNITDTGVLWGTVAIQPLNWVCNNSTCTYSSVPISTHLSLKETATSSATWPFCGWTLNSNSAGTSSTLDFTQSSSDTVTATYGDGTC